MNRGEFLQMLAASAALSWLPRSAWGADSTTGEKMLTRVIPASGAALPVIGLGTWQTFDVGRQAAVREPLAEVLKLLFAAGGSVVDSSPMYGKSEAVVGDLLEHTQSHDAAFVATKVWTRGREQGMAQMNQSFELLKRKRIDLMQIHNLVDWRAHSPVLREWQEAGRIRYIGITHYTSSAYAELEAVMRTERFDFVQLNYSADDRVAEQRLLPLAAERGMAVLVNRPFGGGGLIRKLRDQPLPAWAAEIECESWAQLLLKFIIGHPAVTCAIPGTSNPRHMRDNVGAGFGTLPDEKMRERIVAAAMN